MAIPGFYYSRFPYTTTITVLPQIHNGRYAKPFIGVQMYTSVLLRLFFLALWVFRISPHIINVPFILGYVGLKRTGSGEVKRKRGRPTNVCDLILLMSADLLLLHFIE